MAIGNGDFKQLEERDRQREACRIVIPLSLLVQLPQ